MCGIVAYIGEKQAQEFVINGLKKLEYRGYDSSGISILKDNKIQTIKKRGKLFNLISTLERDPLQGNNAIGHTRWATHGEATDINAHPHLSNSGKISVVHNGIIENYQEIKNFLIDKNYKFFSATDTEVVANLIDYYYKEDLLEAIKKALLELKGAYALAIIASNNPDQLVGVRKQSPLVVGRGKDEYVIASDVNALHKDIQEVYYIDENEIVSIEYNKEKNIDEISFFQREGDNFIALKKEGEKIIGELKEVSKGDYEHFMLKEIEEQPQVSQKILDNYLDKNNNFNYQGSKLNYDILKDINRIYVISCGTAYFAGLCFINFLQELSKDIDVFYELSSEFRFKNYNLDKNSLVITFSQSGETADTLEALRFAKTKNISILSIVNVENSSIARESDFVLYTKASSEIAVASTKAFTSQVLVSYLFALDFLRIKKQITNDIYFYFIKEIKQIPEKQVKSLEQKDNIIKIAKNISKSKSMFFLGRKLEYCIAKEASLKMKEISYIHSEAIAAGELKHGSIALIRKGFPVISIITEDKLLDKNISNIKETMARGAYNIIITYEGNKDVAFCENIITFPFVNSLLSPLVAIVATQLLAYFVAYDLKRDIDMPRNLAKSVTVE